MKEIPAAPPLPNVPPEQDLILGLANQVVLHTGSWCPLATAVNYLVQIAPIVYMAFQARPASPVEVQSASGMSHDSWPLARLPTRKPLSCDRNSGVI
ncbi:hypothetical protein DSO57_1036793 [Entomophthora muscae]|uniref:Uncharacterized protein n=1 Tax=Entomophthora muscae TaxID=34485 RepID=A0ACC2SZ78_9FUNG|nr:hypothetical protein DSO57_1036793 [Entomophthora muscae]